MTESAARELAEEILPRIYSKERDYLMAIQWLMDALLSSRLVEMPRVEDVEKLVKSWGASITQTNGMNIERYREWRKTFAQAIVNLLKGVE